MFQRIIMPSYSGSSSIHDWPWLWKYNNPLQISNTNYTLSHAMNLLSNTTMRIQNVAKWHNTYLEAQRQKKYMNTIIACWREWGASWVWSAFSQNVQSIGRNSKPVCRCLRKAITPPGQRWSIFSILADIEHNSSPNIDVHIKLSEHPSLDLKMNTNYVIVTINHNICAKRGVYQYKKLRQNFKISNSPPSTSHQPYLHSQLAYLPELLPFFSFITKLSAAF
jgi:hypothetical protein